MRETDGGTGFVIRDSGLDIIDTRGCHPVDATVPLVELTAAWAGIQYACRLLQFNYLIVEGDYATVISWIREAVRYIFVHPMIRNISLWL